MKLPFIVLENLRATQLRWYNFYTRLLPVLMVLQQTHPQVVVVASAAAAAAPPCPLTPAHTTSLSDLQVPTNSILRRRPAAAAARRLRAHTHQREAGVNTLNPI